MPIKKKSLSKAGNRRPASHSKATAKKATGVKQQSMKKAPAYIGETEKN